MEVGEAVGDVFLAAEGAEGIEAVGEVGEVEGGLMGVTDGGDAEGLHDAPCGGGDEDEVGKVERGEVDGEGVGGAEEECGNVGVGGRRSRDGDGNAWLLDGEAFVAIAVHGSDGIVFARERDEGVGSVGAHFHKISAIGNVYGISVGGIDIVRQIGSTTLVYCPTPRECVT